MGISFQILWVNNESVIGKSYDKSMLLNFVRKTPQTVFHSGWIILDFHQQEMKVPLHIFHTTPVTHLNQHLVLCVLDFAVILKVV